MHIAAFAGHEGVVRMLLDNRADATVRDADGLTPLDCAAMNGRTAIFDLLRRHTTGKRP